MTRRNSSFSTRKLDYNHKRNTSLRLDDVDRGFRHLMQRLDQVRQDRLLPSFPVDNQHSSSMKHTLDDYNHQLDELEYQANEALASQAKLLGKKSENFQAQLWSQAAGSLEEQSAKIQDIIDQQRAYQQSTIEELQSSFSSIEQNISRRQAIAMKTVQAASDMLNKLQTTFNREPLWQSAQPNLQIQLAQSQSNLEAGFDEASLAGAQSLIQQLIEVQNQLENFVNQRNAAIQNVKDLADKVCAEVSQSQAVHAIDFSGNPIPTELDVNFWTEGGLQPLSAQAQEILQQLQQPPYALTFGHIGQLQCQLEMIEEQIPGVISRARMEVLSSQMRFNIAECAMAALRSQGYELSYGSFAGDDMRCAYQLGLVNFSGSQVFVEVSPVSDQPLVQSLDLKTCDNEALTEHEVSKRVYELKETLHWYGLEVGIIPVPENVLEKNRRQQDRESRLQQIPMLVS